MVGTVLAAAQRRIPPARALPGPARPDRRPRCARRAPRWHTTARHPSLPREPSRSAPPAPAEPWASQGSLPHPDLHHLERQQCTRPPKYRDLIKPAALLLLFTDQTSGKTVEMRKIPTTVIFINTRAQRARGCAPAGTWEGIQALTDTRTHTALGCSKREVGFAPRREAPSFSQTFSIKTGATRKRPPTRAAWPPLGGGCRGAAPSPGLCSCSVQGGTGPLPPTHGCWRGAGQAGASSSAGRLTTRGLPRERARRGCWGPAAHLGTRVLCPPAGDLALQCRHRGLTEPEPAGRMPSHHTRALPVPLWHGGQGSKGSGG